MSISAALQIAFGAVLAVLTTITVERLRKPKLRIEIDDPRDRTYPPGKPAQEMRYLTLKVTNVGLPWGRRWMLRAPATQCHGDISFHHLDGQSIFSRPMPARWAGSVQPIPLGIQLDNGVTGQIIDEDRFITVSTTDVAPGQTALLDLAARMDDEPQCYGWSNESYLTETPWRNPAWQLPQGRYLVQVRLFSAGETFTGLFRLCNEGTVEHFRVEPRMPSDTVRG